MRLFKFKRNPGKRIKTEEIAAARDAVRQAEEIFNQAQDKDLVDAAIYEMAAAEKRLSYLLRQARRERGIA